MNQLLHLRNKILKNGSALARLEAQIPAHPESVGLLSNVLSLRKLDANLRREFQEAADQVGLDVCHYRLLDDQPPVAALSYSLAGFQESLASVYDALKNGPKSRRRLSMEAERESQLRVAYAFPGSFGLAFTVGNERLLLPEVQSHLDRAVETVLTLGKAAGNISVITAAVKQVGRASLIAVHGWAEANSRYGSGAAVEWTRGISTRMSASIQAPEFSALSQTLERFSEATQHELRVSGVLVGADIRSRRFHFVADETLEDIRGSFDDAIGEQQQRLVPARYSAIIEKKVQTTLATEEEKISYFLVRLSTIG